MTDLLSAGGFASACSSSSSRSIHRRTEHAHTRTHDDTRSSTTMCINCPPSPSCCCCQSPTQMGHPCWSGGELDTSLGLVRTSDRRESKQRVVSCSHAPSCRTFINAIRYILCKIDTSREKAREATEKEEESSKDAGLMLRYLVWCVRSPANRSIGSPIFDLSGKMLIALYVCLCVYAQQIIRKIHSK